MKIQKANDHNLRKQISDALTALANGQSAMASQMSTNTTNITNLQSALTTLSATVTALAATVAANAVQRARVQTSVAGGFTWVFPVAYPVGVIPVVEISVESTISGAVWNHVMGTPTNTQVAFTLTRSQSSLIAILGINLLQVTGTPQAFIHLTARAP